MKETGIADRMLIGPEYEFYVFDGVEFDNRPQSTGFAIESEEAHWNTERKVGR